MMKVLEVNPNSPLYGQVRCGYSLISINDKEIEDSLDYCFKVSGEKVKLKFADFQGHKLSFTFNDIQPGELGLKLNDDKIKVCNNNCLFCFVRQQPKGMRRMLYLRDEDYRLSFTHGNFITLSNIKETELKRIVRQRLSPLYISVHTTDDALRRYMLGNKRLPPLMERLNYLTGHRITLHTQVVLCPGINDGVQLERTVNDLACFYPQVASLAVVPVGLTRYREKLPKLRNYNKKEAFKIIDYIENCQKLFLKTLGSRFVWLADEFYILAGRPFPRRSTYEEMVQFENGVGMGREFITVFNRARKKLIGLKSKKRVLFLTGYSAYPFMQSDILPFLKDEIDLNVSIKRVANRFWGKTVTVSGLLTGRDLLQAARRVNNQYDILVLPPNCLNREELFLDDMSLEYFKNKIDKPVVIGRYNLVDTIEEVLS